MVSFTFSFISTIIIKSFFVLLQPLKNVYSARSAILFEFSLHRQMFLSNYQNFTQTFQLNNYHVQSMKLSVVEKVPTEFASLSIPP